MVINRKELKANAKKQIKGNVGTFFGLSIVIGLIISISGITAIGPLLLAGAFSVGIAMFSLEVVRQKKGNFNTGFKGFKQFGSSFVATLLMNIFICLWSLLLFIPGIIATLRYSMTYFILADNPEMSGSEAIKKSKEIMKGHKGELFVLLFSFFWWYVLCLITFGLAAIYVSPYIHATIANLYEQIKGEPAEKIEPHADN
ncbi:DUF975 family protein [Treponema brennaborense]|uniref:Integral membrane protein n=1 Tax=Treponema brennaborense (strain DSM 12168 / CIP 105900 / DD5/3) TaxID=906968 RepID=F4LJZ5_TREBD|nr:DUF975 family protein [Treponema brennaborense]AEE16475.1 protein of unknown function DUF975 [Treponema brennaborense DSM 12168]